MRQEANMKLRFLSIVGITLVLVGSLAGCSQTSGKSAGDAATSAAGTASQEDVIWASGKLLPARWAEISPATAGTVRSVLVAEGERVETGKLLVELDNDILQSQVQVAAAAVTEAEASRDRLLAGATPAELAAAKADVAAAQAAVAQAQAALQQAREAVAAATAQIAIAQAQYDQLASLPTAAERVAAQRQVDQAQAAVRHAQSAYDMVRGDPHIGARPEALALEQATLALQNAKAAYAVATQGATAEQLAVAQAQINAAAVQVQISRAQIPAAEAGVQAAQAGLARAQAALDRLQAGATAEDRAVAAARVKSAQAAQAAAQAQLKQTQVSAPFAGQIGAIFVRPGETALPGQAALILGDTSRMRVETTDLRETDVARLRIGMPAEVTFDALPGRTFQGKIARIAPMSTVEKGSTNYTAVVEVAAPAAGSGDVIDPSLRWGMTAFVNIRVDK
jgi:HlyD family secretion protein